MKEAHIAKNPAKQEEAKQALESLLKVYFNKLKADRLAQAELFLTNIAKQKDMVELVKGKLYYQVLKEGQGPKVQMTDSPSLVYTAYIWTDGKQEQTHQIDKPKQVLLNSTIEGFAQGVSGMKIGETRLLYIHPDLAYGSVSDKVQPNTLVIFEVTVASLNEE